MLELNYNTAVALPGSSLEVPVPVFTSTAYTFLFQNALKLSRTKCTHRTTDISGTARTTSSFSLRWFQPKAGVDHLERLEQIRQKGYLHTLEVVFEATEDQPQLLELVLNGHAPATMPPIQDREGQPHWHGVRIGKILSFSRFELNGQPRGAQLTQWQMPEPHLQAYYAMPPPDEAEYDEAHRSYEANWREVLAQLDEVDQETGVPVMAEPSTTSLNSKRQLPVQLAEAQKIGRFTYQADKLMREILDRSSVYANSRS